MMMPSGQASKHRLHAVQPSVNSGSQIAPGGRTGLAVIAGKPRSRFRRLLSIERVMPLRRLVAQKSAETAKLADRSRQPGLSTERETGKRQ